MDREKRKKGKKRKRTETEEFIAEMERRSSGEDKSVEAIQDSNGDEFEPHPTVSIALPGSILENVPTDELKTYVIGQVSRAAALFNISEVIIFDEFSAKPKPASTRDLNKMFVKVLQYLETPQYLRKLLFPKHSDLQHVGLLHPLNCPHHMKQEEWSKYREGVVLDRPSTKKRGSYVNAGLSKDVRVDLCLQPGLRVTVQMRNPDETCKDLRHFRGTVVSPLKPSLSGMYWGYTVRYADSFSSVFTESSYDKQYDLVIGTSDTGDDARSVSFPNRFKHCLIVFGGLAGLEACLEGDAELKVEDVKLVFDYYLNCCPRQGCRTIRTEEAIFITLASVQGQIF